MDSRPIGVFDSGLGGLTVLRSLIDLLPNENFIYFGDTARTPYGPKPPSEVEKYAIQIHDVLVGLDTKLIVVACNSATSVAYDSLLARSDVPVVGVIDPGVRAAAKATRSKRVGVIGTIGTINSGAYQDAVTRIAPDLQLTSCACPGFTEFVENGDVRSEQVHVLAERLLAPVMEAGVDTLILGCTHYPLLSHVITDVVGRDVVLVSSAEEVAFDVLQTLPADKRSVVTDQPAQHRFITSGDVDVFRKLGTQFLGPEIADVEHWKWPEWERSHIDLSKVPDRATKNSEIIRVVSGTRERM